MSDVKRSNRKEGAGANWLGLLPGWSMGRLQHLLKRQSYRCCCRWPVLRWIILLVIVVGLWTGLEPAMAIASPESLVVNNPATENPVAKNPSLSQSSLSQSNIRQSNISQPNSGPQPGSQTGSQTGAQLLPFYPYPSSVWEKFEQVRQDPRLEQLVQQDIENSLVVRQLIQDEVDRTFSHTTTLLNVLLVVLTAIPVLVAAGFWYLRRSVINQVMNETKQQLAQEVEQQMAQDVAAELKQQAEAFQRELETLRSEFAAQLEGLRGLASDTEQEKNSIIQKLAEILPLPVREGDNPELQQRVQQLTQQLKVLVAANQQLAFSASDYVEQGKALYFEQSYEEALVALRKARAQAPELPRAALMQGMTLAKLQRFEEALVQYDDALSLNANLAEAWFGKATALNKLEQFEAALPAFDRAISLRDQFYQAWFGKARAHGCLGQKEQMLVSLQQAIALEEESNPKGGSSQRCRDAARTDVAFNDFQSLPTFQALLNPSA